LSYAVCSIETQASSPILIKLDIVDIHKKLLSRFGVGSAFITLKATLLNYLNGRLRVFEFFIDTDVVLCTALWLYEYPIRTIK
jgi:hypothetical protein